MKFINVSNEIIYLSIILGFVLPQLGGIFGSYLIHILFVMMTVSLLSVDIHGVEKVRFQEVFYLLVINLVIYSSLIILSTNIIDNLDFRTGMIILAMVPPAIAVVPLSAINKGDVEVSILTEFIGYLICLVYTPLMIWFFLGGIIDVFAITEILAILIIFPFLISRIVRRFWEKSKTMNMKLVISLLIGISVYTSVALSRDIMLLEWRSIIILFIILLTLQLPVGTLIFFLTKKLGIVRKERIEYVLFGTLKNGNVGLGFVLLLIGPAAAVPLAISSIVFGLYVPYLSYLFERHDHPPMKNFWLDVKHFFRRGQKEAKNKLG